MALLFLLPLVLLWVLLIRPQQRRMRQAQSMVATLDVGDEIITSGGIYGTITEVDDTSLWLEIAPDVVVRVLRAAAAQRVPTDLDDSLDDDDDDDEVDADEVDAGDDDGSDDSDIVTPGSNGLSAGVPNTAKPSSPNAGPMSGNDEA